MCDALIFPHQVVFFGVFLKIFLLFLHLFFQSLVVFAQLVDGAKLFPDETLLEGLFYIVT